MGVGGAMDEASEAFLSRRFWRRSGSSMLPFHVHATHGHVSYLFALFSVQNYIVKTPVFRSLRTKVVIKGLCNSSWMKKRGQGFYSLVLLGFVPTDMLFGCIYTAERDGVCIYIVLVATYIFMKRKLGSWCTVLISVVQDLTICFYWMIIFGTIDSILQQDCSRKNKSIKMIILERAMNIHW